MNHFVEECRREWQRLRVPDVVADEMADDLAADLRDAEAEGVSAAEVLGSSASDPRSFAAAWAAERGVVPSFVTRRRFGQPVKLTAVLAVTVIAVVGAALAVFAAPEADDVQGLPRVFEVRPAAVSPDRTQIATVTADGIWITAESGSFRADDDSGIDAHTIGSILLGVGMGGLLVVMLLLYWSTAAGHMPERGGPRYS